MRLYDLGSETPGRIITSHDGAVTSLAFTPDGNAVISGSHDRTARRTRLPASTEEWRSHGYWEQVNSVAISPDGRLIAAGSSDIRFAQQRLEAGARGLGPGAVRLWDARTGRLVRRLGDPTQQVMSVAISPDGRQVASAGAGASGRGAVYLWDVATGAPVWSANEHTTRAIAIAFAPDGSAIASAGDDGTLVLRDPQSGSVVRTLAGHQGGATSVAFTADGAIVCGGGADERAYLWQTRTGRPVRTIGTTTSMGQLLFGRQQALITSVALSADGGTLVTCSGGRDFGDRQVRVWDTQTGALRREFSRPQSAGRFVALSPDGNYCGDERDWQVDCALEREIGTPRPGTDRASPPAAVGDVFRGRPDPGQRRRLPEHEGLGGCERAPSCHDGNLFRNASRRVRGRLARLYRRRVLRGFDWHRPIPRLASRRRPPVSRFPRRTTSLPGSSHSRPETPSHRTRLALRLTRVTELDGRSRPADRDTAEPLVRSCGIASVRQ